MVHQLALLDIGRATCRTCGRHLSPCPQCDGGNVYEPSSAAYGVWMLAILKTARLRLEREGATWAEYKTARLWLLEDGPAPSPAHQLALADIRRVFVNPRQFWILAARSKRATDATAAAARGSK